MSTTPQDNISTVEAWAEVGVHRITCPSGASVKVRVPDLPAIIESGELPQHLLDAALGVASGESNDQKPTRELIAKEREFTDFLVSVTVVEPSLSPETARKVPYEDKEMLVAIATRRRDLDALGDHIGGLQTSEKFRRFRRLGEFDPALEGLS